MISHRPDRNQQVHARPHLPVTARHGRAELHAEAAGLGEDRADVLVRAQDLCVRGAFC